MSHAHSHENTVPRPALAMAISLVVVSLVMTTAVRLGFAEREAVPSVERAKANIAAVETRELVFADRSDGAVLVTDADTKAPVATIIGESGNGGFVRGVLRGLARDRHMRGLGPEAPFKLTLWGDGSLSLTDTATTRTVELGSFGPDNRAAFARFLQAGAEG
jgi:putative photosynthetic complex assembly protein